MLGWLVINHFLNTKKYSEITECLIKSAEKNGIDLIKKTNAELICSISSDKVNFATKPQFVLFWDKDIRLARFLELNGLRLFNSASAIEKCDDKSLTHINLYNSGIRMPKTIIVPKIFHNENWQECCFVDEAVKELGFPLIAKECFGSFGEQVYMAKNQSELVKIMNKIGTSPMLLQEFIATSSGRDIRINIVGGKPVACMYRYSENDDFRANITNGAKMKSYAPNEQQVKMAVETCKILDLDFAGVDILFGENEEPILCEVNSNAHFKNIYDCTKVDVADHIFKYIKIEMEK